MYYQGLADLDLTYTGHGTETQVNHAGVTATLFFNRPPREWTVMIDDPTDQIPLDGLIRASVSLPDGRRLFGAAQRQPILGGCFGLVADNHDEIDLTSVLEQRFAAGQGVVTLSPSMTYEQILTLIKGACTWSNGKAFQVIPPPAE